MAGLLTLNKSRGFGLFWSINVHVSDQVTLHPNSILISEFLIKKKKKKKPSSLKIKSSYYLSNGYYFYQCYLIQTGNGRYVPYVYILPLTVFIQILR